MDERLRRSCVCGHSDVAHECGCAVPHCLCESFARWAPFCECGHEEERHSRADAHECLQHTPSDCDCEVFRGRTCARIGCHDVVYYAASRYCGAACALAAEGCAAA